MKILIITVGNRQVGWRSEDGVTRCLGIDKHATELYKEFAEEIPRNKYPVRHLGEVICKYCQEIGDFGRVELLIDKPVLDGLLESGLSDIWLIATDQPLSVSADYRSADTLWLAKLMEGKIKQSFPDLRVQCWNLQVDVSKIDDIRQEYEEFILKYLLENYQPETTIWIETKGSVPAISSSLEICLAPLTRQFEVIKVTPKEPTPALAENGSANFAVEYTTTSLNAYFFPLEKLRIISAWERGDFREAIVWLEPHKAKLKHIHQLAGYLARAYGYDIRSVLQEIKGQWLPTKKVKQATAPEELEQWNKFQCLNQQNTIPIVWEYSFSIPIDVYAGRLTDAFFTMAQTIERLLYQLYRRDKWVDKGWLTIPEESIEKGFGKERYIPTFEQMISVWKERYDNSDTFANLLHAIRNKRNDIVHSADLITEEEVKKYWKEAGYAENSYESIADALVIPLRRIARRCPSLPDKPLLWELYEWGLQQLKG